MAQPERPLSPFMQYRWQYTNTLSILHRITGILLSLCFFVLVYWLAAAASGPERYAAALADDWVAACPVAFHRRSVLILVPSAERHPAPVLGCRLRIRAACRRKSGWAAAIGAVALTVVLWFVLGASLGGAA